MGEKVMLFCANYVLKEQKEEQYSYAVFLLIC